MHDPLTFAALTVDPATVPVPRVPGRLAIPTLCEPPTRPDAPHSPRADDPLIPLASDRVIDVPAYALAGLPGARRASVARPEVVHRIHSAAQRLPAGFGLAVLDAWRPMALQQMLFDIAYADPTLPPGFVTPPSTNPRTPPPHLTGGTVDVTLTWNRTPLALGTAFDDFTDRAHTRALEGTLDVSRDLRRLLYWTMRSVGFVVLDCEWWHFEYGTPRWAAITHQRPLFSAATAPPCPNCH